MKYGAPKIETTNPTGNSTGAIITLPNVSADRSNNAPMIAVNGRSFVFLAPIRRLAICGAINPRKVMPPPTDTQTPANATETISKILLSFSIWTPTPVATSSPKCKTSRNLALYTA